VAFATGADAPALSLGLDADTEYRNKVPEKGDAWPHLLLEHNLIATPSLQELIAVPFEVQLKLARADAVKHEGWNPQQHTAQFCFYLMVRNTNRKSDLEAMNMGWEVTGPLNVTMQIRGFNRQAEKAGAQ
jgi:hypothetical protein